MATSQVVERQSCRLCLKLSLNNETKVPLYDDNETIGQGLPIKIFNCLAIKVHESDPFPASICHGCHKKLDDFYLFKQECTLSNFKLKQNYEQLLQKLDNVPSHSPNTHRESVALYETETKVSSINQLPVSVINNIVTCYDLPELKDQDDHSSIIKIEPMDEENDDIQEPNEGNLLVDRIENDETSLNSPELAIKIEDSFSYIPESQLENDPLSISETDSISDEAMKPVVLLPSIKLETLDIDEEFETDCEEKGELIYDAPIKVESLKLQRNYFSDYTEMDDEQKMSLLESNIELEEGTHTQTEEEDSDYSEGDVEYVPLDENRSLSQVMGKKIIGFRDGLIKYRTVNTSTSTRELRVPFKCTICRKKFRRSSDLRIHQETHLNNHYKPLICCVCPKSFTHKLLLVQHEKTHISNPNKSHLKCKLCISTFITLSELKTHQKEHDRLFDSIELNIQKSIGGKSELMTCNQCERVFCYLQPFKNHVRNCQALKKTVPTTFVKFSESSEVKSQKEYLGHQNKVNGKEPFQCKLCSLQFSNKSDLICHEASAHRVSDSCEIHSKKILACNSCPMTFLHFRDLAIHQAHSHTPRSIKPPGIFSCALCKIIFDRQWELIQHEQRVHLIGVPLTKNKTTTVKPPQIFKCELCAITFPQKGALICHQAFYHRKEANKNISQLTSMF